MSRRCLGCMEKYGQEFNVCPHCGYVEGTDVEEAIHIEPGTLLHDRYIIGKVLGFGGFGVTYIGWDGRLEQKVAIKEYLPSEFSTRMPGQTSVTVFSGEKSEQFHDGLNKFVDEAKRLAKFQNEDGIVKVFDSFTDNETAYIIMEFLDGETLSDKINKGAKYTEEDAIGMLLPVMNSLQTIHEEGILHRDIAPDNIFITNSGEVKLIDFGASRYATTSHSRSLTVIIKPGYSPEEQYRSRGDQGPHTDVYALAAVMYKMMTGITPPDALERRASIETKKKDLLKDIRKTNKKVSRSVENAILNAMNVRIEDRTASITDFVEELNSNPPVKRRYGKIKKIDIYAWPMWLKISLGTLLLALLISGTLLLTGVISFHSLFSDEVVVPEGFVVVPDVEGKDKDAALTELEKNNLIPSPDGNIESEYIEVGKIVLQTPQGGTYLQKNEKVSLLVSSGSGIVEVVDGIATVPYVVWDTQDDAVTKLLKAGLAEPAIETAFDENVAAGKVISQSVEAGTKVDENTKITIVVSKGSQGFAMPNVTGKTKSEAEKTLVNLGLLVSVEYQKSDTVAENKVISQSIISGAIVEKGSKITLIIASGKPVFSVSNVVGKTKEDAVSILEKQGFKVAVLENYSSTIAKNIVIEQTPVAGSEQIKGSTITVTISKGKETIYASSIALNKRKLTLDIGDTSTLTATISPENTTDKTVEWVSSNSQVANVNSLGIVTAVTPGNVTIIAKTNSGKVTATCSVTVSNITMPTFDDVTITVGDTKTYTAATVVKPGVTSSVSWSSSNTSVATVSDGKVSAKAPGTATITVTLAVNGVKATETFKVTVPTPYVSLSSTSGSSEISTSTSMYKTSTISTGAGEIDTLDTPFYGWRFTLPSGEVKNLGGGYVYVTGWEVISGNAVAMGHYVYIGGPGTVKVRYWCAGYYADYTYTLSMYKTTSATNTIRSGPGTTYSKVGTVPGNTKVYITEIKYSGTPGQSGTRAWGKISYGGKSGYITLFYW